MHVDIRGVMKKRTEMSSSAERGRQAAYAAMLALETSRFCVYAAVPLGETLYKNYQASCDTFLYCVFRKFWGTVSCLCLV